MSTHAADEIARAGLARAVAVWQLLDEHREPAGYRTSAGWLTALARCSQGASSEARRYLVVTEAELTMARRVDGWPDTGAVLSCAQNDGGEGGGSGHHMIMIIADRDKLARATPPGFRA